ncbi:MAG: HDOD domain-containing protein [Treponema sp.]|nr:HDOD domain-containing protein [Treponema sp.]
MDEQILSVDTAKIRMAINSGVPLSITTYTLPHNMEVYMNEILTCFFKELHQEQMIQYITYCQNELITNAKKANTKRVYFKDKGLDINNPEDYEEGMKSFKVDTLSNINYYLSNQKHEGLYVRLVIQVRDNVIRMEIHNNSELTYTEYKRIQDKISRAQQYTSIEDTLNSVLDESEGAGLGLIILILMLRKLGMSEDNFQTVCEKGVTITRLCLPIYSNTKTNIDIVTQEFQDGIDVLPQFPENITHLNSLLSDPEVSMSEVAASIGTDATLTGELLKQVNSAAFSLNQPCSNIADAVKMVGLRGVRNMLYTIGTMQVFSKLPGNSEKLWAHSYKVAFYSFNLAYNFFQGSRDVIENVYTCGLLHDMGKIIFEASHPKYLEKVKNLCQQKGIESEVFEKILCGVNHGEIGAKVAEKWNFPDVLTQVIRYHHSPESAPEFCKRLSMCVYLADLMVHYTDGECDFYQVDRSILAQFKITSEEQFKMIVDRINQKMERH